MKKYIFLILPAVFLFCMIVCPKAYAHALWIEKDAEGKMGVCFGEYGENVREKSAGKLAEIQNLEVWTADANGAKKLLPTSLSEDRFVLTEASLKVAAQDTKLPVKDYTKHKLGIVKPFLYARHAATPETDLKPEMHLDILPAARDKIAVFFNGQILPGEKIVLTAPNGWTKEYKTDTEGASKMELPWPGLYVAEVTHTVDSPGRYLDKDYEAERHRATLSFVKA